MSASVATHTAAVLHGPKDMRLEQRPLLPPGQGECTVQVISTGLCGSDLHYYTHGRNGDFALQAPLVLGHESAGVITAVGPGVRDLVVGQRVAIEAGVMCNACDFCRGRRYNLCKRLRFCSSAKTFPHLDGTLQTAINHPAHVLHPLPDACTFDQAALAEPLSVLLHAARRANLAAGQSVLVYGVGAIGLLAAALARALGARRVCAVDINPQRLALSTAEGYADAAHCLPTNLPPPANSDEALARAKTNADTALEVFKEQDGFDVVFECTGAEPCIQMAIHTAITGGKVMLVGMGARNVTLPLSSAALREVDIQGSFRYAHTYPEALELLGKRAVRVEPLVTHRFPLERAADAFALLAKGRDEQGKVVLKVMVDGA